MLQRLHLLFAGLGVAATGVLLYVGPDPIAAEFRLHREAGAGAGALGALLLFLAFAGDGAVANRLKHLIIAATSLGFAGLFAAGVLPDAIAAWKLKEGGLPATAVVTSAKIVSVHSRQSGRSTIRRAEVEYAGHRAALKIAAGRGQRVPVLYLPAEPQTVLPGEPGDSVIRLATGGRTWPWIAIGLALLTGGFGLSNLASVLATRPGPPRPGGVRRSP